MEFNGKMTNLGTRATKLLLTTTIVAVLAGCGPTPPANVAALRRVTGTDLIGTIGATPTDQDNINRTVIRFGAAGIYTKAELARHEAALQAAQNKTAGAPNPKASSGFLGW
jgi:hypothetical protein